MRRKPEANDAHCPSWVQKPRGDGEREGGKGRGAPSSARISVAAHVAIRHGTERGRSSHGDVVPSARDQLASSIQCQLGHS